jgi:hypothetical protein
MKLTYKQLRDIPQYRTTNKLYFKKYPFVVRFFRAADWNDRYQNYYRIVSVKRWLEKNNHFDYRTRTDYGLSIYLEDLESLYRVYKKYYNEIEFVDGPISDKHQTTMETEPTVSVRKQLFYNKYRYKVSSHLVRSEMDKWTSMIELCQDSFDNDNYKMNSTLKNYINNKEYYKNRMGVRGISAPSFGGYNQYNMMPWSATGTIYLKKYDDLCTLHLMYKNIISSTTKVMLDHELE